MEPEHYSYKGGAITIFSEPDGVHYVATHRGGRTNGITSTKTRAKKICEDFITSKVIKPTNNDISQYLKVVILEVKIPYVFNKITSETVSRYIENPAVKGSKAIRHLIIETEKAVCVSISTVSVFDKDGKICYNPEIKSSFPRPFNVWFPKSIFSKIIICDDAKEYVESYDDSTLSLFIMYSPTLEREIRERTNQYSL